MCWICCGHSKGVSQNPQAPGSFFPLTRVATHGQQVALFVTSYNQQGGAKDLFYPKSPWGVY